MVIRTGLIQVSYLVEKGKTNLAWSYMLPFSMWCNKQLTIYTKYMEIFLNPQHSHIHPRIGTLSNTYSGDTICHYIGNTYKNYHPFLCVTKMGTKWNHCTGKQNCPVKKVNRVFINKSGYRKRKITRPVFNAIVISHHWQT